MSDADQTKKAATLSCAPRMTDIMARTAVDLDQALQLHAGAVLGATLLCKYCENTGACEEWIATHEEGDGHAVPEFCPNDSFIRSLAPKAK